MKIVINIDSDNDAYQDDGAVDMTAIATDLHELVRRIAQGDMSGRMGDANGNTAIRFNITD